MITEIQQNWNTILIFQKSVDPIKRGNSLITVHGQFQRTGIAMGPYIESEMYKIYLVFLTQRILLCHVFNASTYNSSLRNCSYHRYQDGKFGKKKIQ